MSNQQPQAAAQSRRGASDGSAKRGIVCAFCGEAWGYEGEQPTDALIKEAVDHEAKCPRNPYLAQIEKLKSEVEHWKAVANYYRNASPNDQTLRPPAQSTELPTAADGGSQQRLVRPLWKNDTTSETQFE